MARYRLEIVFHQPLLDHSWPSVRARQIFAGECGRFRSTTNDLVPSMSSVIRSSCSTMIGADERRPTTMTEPEGM
jgi:hypothetical protein